MSWNAYRDSLLQTGAVSQACLLGLADGGVWTTSPDLQVTPEEAMTTIKAFSDNAQLRSQGLVIAGKKYFCLTSDDCQIQLKKGTTGVSIAKTNKCVVIGIYSDNQQPGNCRSAVEKIADHLRNSSY